MCSSGMKTSPKLVQNSLMFTTSMEFTLVLNMEVFIIDYVSGENRSGGKNRKFITF
jgi:hypothetical protein